MTQQPPKILYLLVEAAGKTYWNRAGVGFVNTDNSINIKLDLFPGLIFNLRDPKPSSENEPTLHAQSTPAKQD